MQASTRVTDPVGGRAAANSPVTWRTSSYLARAYTKVMFRIRAGMLAFCLLTAIAVGADSPSDTEVREMIVAQSLHGYAGSCPCPYNVDRAGRQCGARSAWNRPGGSSPICFTHEVSDDQVRAFRDRMRT